MIEKVTWFTLIAMQSTANITDSDRKLIDLAMNHAKARYKKDFISIGAVLLAKNGKTYTGTNTKYHVRNLSTCAEMLAIYKALDDGVTEFDMIVAVRYMPDSDTYEVVNGCGKCRQLFCYHVPLGVIVDRNGTLAKVQAEDLLPYAFL